MFSTESKLRVPARKHTCLGNRICEICVICGLIPIFASWIRTEFLPSFSPAHFGR
jgi:hypothetical protein